VGGALPLSLLPPVVSSPPNGGSLTPVTQRCGFQGSRIAALTQVSARRVADHMLSVARRHLRTHDVRTSSLNKLRRQDSSLMTHDTYVGMPRPVFEGDWSTASGKERQAHMVRINAWKFANSAVTPGADSDAAQTRMNAGNEEAERHAADLATLDSVINSAKALNSDRIRAIEAKQRILAKVYEEEARKEHGPLLELRNALDLLPPDERVAALGTLLDVTPLDPS
jgi:hypothetical protein